MSDVLARRDQALTPEETAALLRDRLGDDAVVDTTIEYSTFTVRLRDDAWVEAARRCRDEPLLAYDLFDCLLGIDAREEGFDVVAVLYSTSTGNRIALRTRCPGGREAPRLGSITDVYRGADWMERETWDMFGIEFDGHPALEPRILTVENFEGWPLRKDFHLTSRVAKPWPGVKEPAELDEEGNVVERVARVGDAPGPYELDKAMAEQAKRANPEITPATDEGEAVEAAAATADVAGDSAQVLAGEQEREEEVAEAEATDIVADVVEGETADAAEGAKQRAEETRRGQAEARARKAAERTQQATDPERDDSTDDADGGDDTGRQDGARGEGDA